ncbi:hypothetical protein Pfo_026752 [Paulownia fortunei]|nr:hypothetical protein Pfo_026752 [Paulownia fortunei]
MICPCVVFEAESLQDLHLWRCKLDLKYNIPYLTVELKQTDTVKSRNVLFKNLKRLCLNEVYIEEETFQKIISSCPFIEAMGLENCKGLRTIKVNKLHNLKDFAFSKYEKYKKEDSSIIINVPTLETINIDDNANCFHDHRFPNLKTLSLSRVGLSTKSFPNL